MQLDTAVSGAFRHALGWMASPDRGAAAVGSSQSLNIKRIKVWA